MNSTSLVEDQGLILGYDYNKGHMRNKTSIMFKMHQSLSLYLGFDTQHPAAVIIAKHC